jgi:hypothetical protein
MFAIAVACTEFKPGSDIQSTRGSLTGNDAPNMNEGPWGCLDESEAMPEMQETVSYTVTIVDSLTNAPPPGLVVRACDDLDLTCARPVSSSTGVSADGRVRLSLAQGFDGFLQIESDSTLPTRLYPDGLLLENQDGALLELVDANAVAQLAGAVGLELREDQGVVLARAFDCNGDLASGITFESEAGGVAFAFVDGLPIRTNTTATEGLVVFANVPRGFTLIEGSIAQTERFMGSTTAESLPGAIVYVDVRP